MTLARAEQELERRAPSRWQAALALFAVGVAGFLLPQRYRLGPPWLLLAIVGLIAVPLLVAHRRGRHEVARYLGLASVILSTIAILVSASLLLVRLPGDKTAATDLLRDSALIWFGNVLVFALWYWEVDGGGPGRRRFGAYRSSDFCFPQFQQDPEHAGEHWMPEFLDYLFLAFNTSTAFSPTDTLIFSRRAKLLLMGQALISLLTIGVLAARAINTL